MKLKYTSAAALAAVSLLLSSCVYGPVNGYGTISYSTNGYSSSVAWANASYDADGFPIFGYSYGRPVYGYTEAGVAIFTIAALTALCFVPHWKPAPWYHGHWHYPPHIHRVARPPHFPTGHHPGLRPPGGLNAPIHKNPGSVFSPNPGHRPGAGHHAAPDHQPGMGGNPAPRPQLGNNRPGGNRPNAGARPGMGSRPQSRLAMGNNRPQNRPAMGARPASRPSMGAGARPGGGSRPGGHGGGHHRR